MNNRAKIKALQAKIRALQAELVVERCWTERYRNLWLQELAAIHKTAVPQTVKPTESHQPCGERRMPTLDFDHTTDEQCRWVQDEDNLALWWTGCHRYLDEGLVEQSSAAEPICCYCQKPKRLVRVTP